MPKLLKIALVFTIITIILLFIAWIYLLVTYRSFVGDFSDSSIDSPEEGFITAIAFGFVLLIYLALFFWISLSLVINLLTVVAILRAKNSKGVFGWGATVLLFFNIIGGILLLCCSDQKFEDAHIKKKLTKLSADFKNNNLSNTNKDVS